MMHTNSPRPLAGRLWATYAKAAALIVPTLVAWVFACSSLAPKVKEISRAAGVNPSQLGWIGPATYFLVAWGGSILVAGILAVVVLEFIAPRWWRRELVVSTGLWVTNAVVLFTLCMLLVIICVSAPGLAHH